MTWRLHLFACTFEKMNDMFHQVPRPYETTILRIWPMTSYMITKPPRLNKNLEYIKSAHPRQIPNFPGSLLDPLLHMWWPPYHRDSEHAYLYVHIYIYFVCLSASPEIRYIRGNLRCMYIVLAVFAADFLFEEEYFSIRS